MPKLSTVYVCQKCGYSAPKWMGQCSNCQAWNSFEETIQQKQQKSSLHTSSILSTTLPFSKVKESDVFQSRLFTTVSEFDRVLGGGIVLGSVSLIGGEPGIGKSTLLTQIVVNILMNGVNCKDIFYVCGEESPEQISMRVRRICDVSEKKLTQKSAQKYTNKWKDRLIFLPSTDTDACVQAIEQQKPGLVIVDSIQSMQTSDLTGAAGSVGQLKESTLRFTRSAKSLGIPIFLVGHVTKEGAIAGPKVLEHIVDTVLELSGERSGFFRLLRSGKNRFGPTDEVGVFEVKESGLSEVKNPSMIFLSEEQSNVAGSAIVPVMEGTRVMMIEIQALVVPSQLAMPRRVGRGVSLSRIQLLCAVLQKHCKLKLSEMDVFINVAGGFTVQEPAVDLGIAMAIASSVKNVPLKSGTVYAGEIGLLGEVRQVSMEEQRKKEAKRLGFSHVISGSTQKRLERIVSSIG